MMRPACPECGFIHARDDSRAVGLFDPSGPRGYMAKSGGPLRNTRADAERDECEARQRRRSTQTPQGGDSAAAVDPRPRLIPGEHSQGPVTAPNPCPADPFPSAAMETAARAKAWHDFLAEALFSLEAWRIDPALHEGEHVLTWLRRCRDELDGLVRS